MATLLGFTISNVIIALIAIAALIVACIAYVRSLGASGHGDHSYLAYSAGMDETTSVSVGNGDNLVGVANGVTSLITLSTAAERIRAMASVAPYRGVARNLRVAFSANTLTGATSQTFSATLYKLSAKGTCGDDLTATKLTVSTTITALQTDYCLHDTCHSVKVCAGDRLALVLSSGTEDADLATLFDFSGGIEYDTES